MANQSEQPDHWEREALQNLLQVAVKEQQRNRFWRVFFKLLTFIYLFLLLFYLFDWIGDSKLRSSSNHTALIDIHGVIGAEDDVVADDVIASLREAYDNHFTKGIILRINSPGGSPVQAGIINDEIRRQKRLHPNIPVYAVVEDVCASGGYYIAVAADKIYVDKASIVGSIGVLMDGFGFTGVMQKLGVERRLMTAGENKAMLDAFSPVNPKHKQYIQSVLDEVHQQFINVVKQGRGARLQDNPEIFSGLFWNGERSVQLGLADGMGSADYVAREVIKQENIVDFTGKEDFANRLAKRIGASMTQTLAKSLEMR
jgi:protease-4